MLAVVRTIRRKEPIVEIIAHRTFSDGEVVFLEGDGADSVYIVESGAVIITRNVGARKLIVDVLRSGEIFVEMAFIGSSPRTATARVLGETVLGVISRESLMAGVKSLPPDLGKLFVSLVARLKKMTDTAAGMTALRQEQRLAKTWSLSFSNGSALEDAYTQNASGGGLFIATSSPLDPGELFLLDLDLPGGERITKAACEVVWNRTQTDEPRQFPLGMGIRFLLLSSQDQDILTGALAADE